MSAIYARTNEAPDHLTPGMIAAIDAADSDGWIIPPIESCLAPPSPRGWRCADTSALFRAGLTTERVLRRDSQFNYRIGSAARSLREAV